MSAYVKLMPVIPTFAAMLGGFAVPDELANINFTHISSVYEGREIVESGNAQTQYHTTIGNIEAVQNIQTIHKFSINLLENIEDLDPEFSKAIDENFWDLI